MAVALPSRAHADPGLRAFQYSLERTMLSVSVFGLSVLLLVVWRTFSTVTYAYEGYRWNPSWGAIVFGVVTTSAIAWFLPTRLRRPGDIAIYILVVFAYLPGMIIPPALIEKNTAEILSLQIVLSVCVLLVMAANQLPRVVLRFSLFTDRVYSAFLVILFLFLFVPIVRYIGVPRSVPSFADVYIARTRTAEAMAASPVIVGYLWGFLTSALNPYLVVYGIVQRKALMIGLGLAGTLYIYSMAGSKSVLFSVLLMLAVLAGMRLMGTAIPLLVFPALCVMVGIARLIDQAIPVPWATAVLVDRAMIIPGVLTGYYFEFFSTNEKGHWGYTFLAPVYSYPYEHVPARIIGIEYFLPTTEANAHLWTDGYANFGYSGMFFVSLIAGTLVWLLNSAATGRSRYLLIPLTAASAYTMASMSIFTALLTSGLGLIVVLVLLSPVHDIEQPERYEAGPRPNRKAAERATVLAKGTEQMT